MKWNLNQFRKVIALIEYEPAVANPPLGAKIKTYLSALAATELYHFFFEEMII